MGTITIWDGKHLPPIGYEVLFQLASSQRPGDGKWLPHKVTGYRIEADLNGNKHVHRVFIEATLAGTSAPNARLLCDVRPVNWREDHA